MTMDEFGRYALYLGGALNLGLIVFHGLFWRLFRWRDELARLSGLNRNVMQIMNLCLMVLFAVLAYLSFAHAPALLASPLGHAVLAGFAVFWILRAAEQVWFFGLKAPLSVFFTGLFATQAGLCVAPLALAA